MIKMSIIKTVCYTQVTYGYVSNGESLSAIYLSSESRMSISVTLIKDFTGGSSKINYITERKDTQIWKKEVQLFLVDMTSTWYNMYLYRTRQNYAYSC